jgi:telomerase reverse transcriptase
MHFIIRPIGSKEKLRDGGHGRKFMPWCGLLIDESTLEVRADYDRLCGSSLLDGLRVFKRADLRKRLINFLCPKCHPIFFHPRLNTSFTALLNYYQVRKPSATI